MKVIPLNNDTLVKPFKKKETLSSGIFDPNANIKDNYSYGKVLAIGDSVKNVSIGDWVLMPQAVPVVNHEDELHYFANEERYIIAKLENVDMEYFEKGIPGFKK